MKISDPRNSLLVAFAVSTGLLLPLAARAGAWPAGKKAEYVGQCMQVAAIQGVDTKKADQKCKCSADAIEKNFTSAEIEVLSGQDNADAKLMQRALTVIQTKCGPTGK
ncbi:hypothetical protein [Myxococcus landrumensis]|uniref:Lipoprotein n=1 Tax=Myxococcus landrumensis TaxID=2813577 RepID=A0ABX7N7Y6_9BACT|nr:hypothetical protein [Myxococcus landrumus]QSQ14855.1 hypothetical protein JY572_01825 [Myxococcus landrumus]